MTTITDQDWKEIKKRSKNKQSISENVQLKIIRKVVQDPSSIEYLFGGYRRGIKEKLNDVKKLQMKLSKINASDETKIAYDLTCLFAQRYLEMFQENATVVEALAFQNIESIKNLYKLIRLIRPTKNKSKELNNLLKKIEKKELANTKFLKDNERYIKRLKDTWDYEAKETTEI